MTNTVDLDNPPDGHQFSVKMEVAETKAERGVRLAKDVAIFVFALVLAIGIVVLCLSTLFSATSSPEEKKWAQSIFSAAAGGVFGYLLKK